MKQVFKEQAAKWPSTWVSRREIENFTGGAVSAKFMANCDSAGVGPGGRFKIGRSVCYPVNELLVWLLARAGEVT